MRRLRSLRRLRRYLRGRAGLDAYRWQCRRTKFCNTNAHTGESASASYVRGEGGTRRDTVWISHPCLRLSGCQRPVWRSTAACSACRSCPTNPQAAAARQLLLCLGPAPRARHHFPSCMHSYFSPLQGQSAWPYTGSWDGPSAQHSCHIACHVAPLGGK